MKKVAVLQSNYLPWKGYFDIINDVDLFVFYDDVQYTKNDWRNRNRVRPQGGECWISVPTGQNIDRKINEVEIANHQWQQKHYRLLTQGYAKSPHLGLYRSFLDEVFLNRQWQSLSELNQFTIKTISRDFLGIDTRFVDSSEYSVPGSRLDRLVNLLEAVDAKEYVSGPSAASYIDEDRFNEAGIKLTYKNYSDYPVYKQLVDGFNHYVSILDLLFMTGTDAPWYIWGWRKTGDV